MSSLQKTNSYNWHKLRSWLYHHTKYTTLHSLPPSKGAILAHISRSFYISYQMCSILDEVKAKQGPTDFGYIMDNDLLLLSNIISQLPDNMTAVCNCQHCATKRCNCRKLSISWSKFCKCMDKTGKSVECKKSIHIVLVVLKGIRNVVLKNTAALPHIVM